MPEIDGISLEQVKSKEILTDREGRQYHKDVTDTFEVNQDAAKAVRNEIPIGVSGQPIERIPRNAQLVALMNAGTYIKRIASQDRCLRLVTLPLRGGKEGEFHCSMPCIAAGADGEKHCPDHEPGVFRPIQTHAPRKHLVFSSADIELTEAEKMERWRDKEGKMHEAELLPGRDIGAERAARDAAEKCDQLTPVEVKRAVKRMKALDIRVPRKPKIDPNEVVIRLKVSDLAEGDGDQTIYRLITSVVRALDFLPAGSIADMKRVVAIQEKLSQYKLEEEK